MSKKIRISDQRCYSQFLVLIMQKNKYFFSCLTPNVKYQFIAVFKNHLFIYICYCSGIIQSQKYMNWISDLFLQNDFKYRKAASHSEKYWIIKHQVFWIFDYLQLTIYTRSKIFKSSLIFIKNWPSCSSLVSSDFICPELWMSFKFK